MTNRFAVETAIYRVSPTVKMILTDHYFVRVGSPREAGSAHYNLRIILFESLNQGSDPLFIIYIRQWEGVLVKTCLLVINFHPYSQDDAS
ncbi:hypothetical protein [Nostoc commune]|uniref:hypothetical protein n=1 Tax=Nostoc commune TaxID=1178 RepID=UPI0018C7DC77|nr:hypothetical protein [Nostoc commune]MBG1262064.1 hypothetical protein [Nostoc commune BAE]